MTNQVKWLIISLWVILIFVKEVSLNITSGSQVEVSISVTSFVNRQQPPKFGIKFRADPNNQEYTLLYFIPPGNTYLKRGEKRGREETKRDRKDRKLILIYRNFFGYRPPRKRHKRLPILLWIHFLTISLPPFSMLFLYLLLFVKGLWLMPLIQIFVLIYVLLLSNAFHGPMLLLISSTFSNNY